MKIFENQCITRRAFLTTDTDKNLLFDSRSIEKYWKLEICPAGPQAQHVVPVARRGHSPKKGM